MSMLSVYHPDILEFIHAKSATEGRLNHFNLSVVVDDAFMNLVITNGQVQLHWPIYDEKGNKLPPDKWDKQFTKLVPARDIWNEIMQMAYDNGEPGVFYEDNANNRNPAWYVERIVCSNPCAEYLAGTINTTDPSQYGGACNLGSLFLHNFVKNPFTKQAHLDTDALRNTISIAVRMLDDIIDVNKFPDKIYENYQKGMRTIGIGITGLADMLAMLGMKYDSQEARDYVESLMQMITNAEYYASVQLAKEKGCFPLCEPDNHMRGNYVMDTLEPTLAKDIAKYGIRNAKIQAVAPCGTISMVFGNNCSSGIEPIFSLSYDRKVKIGGQDDKDVKIVKMMDYAYYLYHKLKDQGKQLDFDDHDIFPTALNMSVDDHVAMLAIISKYTDMSVSKTINVPTEASFDEVKDIYIQCWKKGIKGCTIFRPNAIRQGILITDTKKDAETKPEPTSLTLPRGSIIEPSNDLIGKKRKIQTGCVDADTEFFTGTGWKRIADYKDGDKVLQYNQDGTASLVEPLDYIVNKTEGLYHIKTKYGLDMMLSKNHRNVTFRNPEKSFKIQTTEEILGVQNKTVAGFDRKFKKCFSYGGKGINLTDDEIRISVAIFADGCFYSETSKKCIISVTKKRKRDRLVELLTSAHIDFSERLDNDGYYNIKFYPPINGRQKTFPVEWYDCSNHQLQVIFEEVFRWDGYEKKMNQYTTIYKENADFVQFVCSSLNKSSSIYRDNRTRNGTNSRTCYRVDWTNRVLRSIVEKPKKEIPLVMPDDGLEYCFTVPSSMLVLRRNDNIFITGNCGSLHVLAFFDPIDGNLQEVYLNKGSDGGCQNFMIGLSRMVSLLCRAGVDIMTIKDQLDSTGVCPSYATRRATHHDTSKGSCCPMAIGNALVDMYNEMQAELDDKEEDIPITSRKLNKASKTLAENFDKATEAINKVVDKIAQIAKDSGNVYNAPTDVCPECGEPLLHIGGCIQCSSCAWSKCE